MKHMFSGVALALVCVIAIPLSSFAFQDTPVYRIGGGVSSPQPILKFEPEYTEAARIARIQGDVLLTVVVDEKGIPAKVEVVRSLDPDLDAQAVQTMMKWRFKPGMKDGKAVAVQATMQITFKLL